jgi:hypothetical protein
LPIGRTCRLVVRWCRAGLWRSSDSFEDEFRSRRSHPSSRSVSHGRWDGAIRIRPLAQERADSRCLLAVSTEPNSAPLRESKGAPLDGDARLAQPTRPAPSVMRVRLTVPARRVWVASGVGAAFAQALALAVERDHGGVVGRVGPNPTDNLLAEELVIDLSPMAPRDDSRASPR